jgi:hypothetical protein
MSTSERQRKIRSHGAKKPHRLPRESRDRCRAVVKAPLEAAWRPSSLMMPGSAGQFDQAHPTRARGDLTCAPSIQRTSLVHAALGACITRHFFGRLIYSAECDAAALTKNRCALVTRSGSVGIHTE